MKKIPEYKWQELLERRKRAKIASYQRYINKRANSPEYFKRRLLNEVRISNRKLNVFNYAPNNTKEHEVTKFLVFMYYRDLGYDVLTEAIFNNGSRADVVVLDRELIVEILCSETREMLDKKVVNYPSCFEIVSIDATKEFNEADLE